MDFTGVTNINVLSSEHADIVFIGDSHSMYNPFTPNVLHNWIDTAITQAPTSYAVVEDRTLSLDTSFIMHVVPRYFRATNIYHCDEIRFLFMYCDKNEEAWEYVYKYLTEFKSQSPVVRGPIFSRDLRDLMLNEGTPRKRHLPDYKYFATKLQNTPKTHLYADVDMLEKALTFTSTMIENYFAYELTMLHYLYFSFIYQVVNWIKRNYKNTTSLPCDNTLWGIVSEWHIFTACPPEKINEIFLMTHLLDYVFITHILHLIESNKPTKILIWVPAGSNHTSRVHVFLERLFRFMKHNPTSDSIEEYENPDASSEVYNLIGKFPDIGLRQPDYTKKPRAITSEELRLLYNDVVAGKSNATALIDTVIDTKFSIYRLHPECIDSIKRMLKSIEQLDHVILLIDLMQTKEITNHYLRDDLNRMFSKKTLESLKNVIKVNGYKAFIEGTGGRYGSCNYSEFDFYCKAIFIPYISDNDLQIVSENSITMSKYMEHPHNVSFDKLVDRQSILQVEDNQQTPYIKTSDAVHHYNENYYIHLKLFDDLYTSSIDDYRIDVLKKYISRDKAVGTNLLKYNAITPPAVVSNEYYSDEEYHSDDEEMEEFIKNEHKHKFIKEEFDKLCKLNCPLKLDKPNSPIPDEEFLEFLYLFDTEYNNSEYTRRIQLLTLFISKKELIQQGGLNFLYSTDTRDAITYNLLRRMYPGVPAWLEAEVNEIGEHLSKQISLFTTDEPANNDQLVKYLNDAKNITLIQYASTYYLSREYGTVSTDERKTDSTYLLLDTARAMTVPIIKDNIRKLLVNIPPKNAEMLFNDIIHVNDNFNLASSIDQPSGNISKYFLDHIVRVIMPPDEYINKLIETYSRYFPDPTEDDKSSNSIMGGVEYICSYLNVILVAVLILAFLYICYRIIRYANLPKYRSNRLCFNDK